MHPEKVTPLNDLRRANKESWVPRNIKKREAGNLVSDFKNGKNMIKKPNTSKAKNMKKQNIVKREDK